jgi:hypothetical protein
MTFNECPGCGTTGGFKVQIFRCSMCLRYYCYKCPSSNGGRWCPECKSTSATEVGMLVYR